MGWCPESAEMALKASLELMVNKLLETSLHMCSVLDFSFALSAFRTLLRRDRYKAVSPSNLARRLKLMRSAISGGRCFWCFFLGTNPMVSCAAVLMRSRSDSHSPERDPKEVSAARSASRCWNFFCTSGSRRHSTLKDEVPDGVRVDLILRWSSATNSRWSVLNWALLKTLQLRSNRQRVPTRMWSISDCQVPVLEYQVQWW